MMRYMHRHAICLLELINKYIFFKKGIEVNENCDLEVLTMYTVGVVKK